ncbi:uncharacterized protein ARMOST_16206 [Armillaria ostoyae]|uniref:Reverse transcriptase domain-containing protein n=1 Tax=Armillaria ostoyae TaxID=47428 RepID=A0A284RVN3_ARMOS|nr:uncharacterized protein ARMOST_16206 [Armillaria ostoyae]
MQPGVHGHDLTSFLAQLESWSNCTHTLLYILHHDQCKGFDRLEPEGFYNAVQAYGLPSALIDFDISAQTDVSHCAKIFFRFTDTFVLNGVMKQGSSLSPIKCTITGSMGNHWLADSIAARMHGTLILWTAMTLTSK